MENLYELSRSHVDPKKQLKFSEELIKQAKKLDSASFEYWGFIYKGYALGMLGNISEGLESLFQAARIADSSLTEKESAQSKVAIGDTYANMGDTKNAVEYYRSAIPILRRVNDSLNLGAAFYNLSDLYLDLDQPDSALVYLDKSGEIFQKTDQRIHLAYNTGNLGRAYAMQGNEELAEENLNQAILELEKEKDYYAISDFLYAISSIYFNQNKMGLALRNAQRSLKLAQMSGLKDQISSTSLLLSEIYEKLGYPAESLKYYKAYNIYKDSVNNIATVQEMANIRTEYEVAQKQLEISQKQVEVDLLEKEAQIRLLKERRQKNLLLATGAFSVLIFLLALGLLRRFNYIKKTSKIIEEEKNRSDHLLLNILPSGTAQELKKDGKVKAKKFDSVSVLFTDFQSFTQFSQNLNPEKLVKSVDFYFSQFDRIIEKYQLEKIKTIGDSYMCAGGLPEPCTDHPQKIVMAAFEILKFVEEAKKVEEDIAHFNIRIGINTGPVVAGVVGTKKFAYDIWGDTVNIASRMESSSEIGKVNISENTYQLIKDVFDCSYRGEIYVKNKGMMRMYFVNGKKTKTPKPENIQEIINIQQK